MATLVVLAAGRGLRFGAGLKQLASVGPDGEAIADYTIRDAVHAGFDEIVVIVRPEIRSEVAQHLGRRAALAPVYVEKPEPRGTADAVARLRGVVAAPFAVVNADDYYGASALAHLHDRITTGLGPDDACAVLYEVTATLPETGAVTRGICEHDGRVVSRIHETAVARTDDGILTAAGDVVAPDTLVSMNLWGFHPSVIAAIADTPAPETAEYRLPDFVDNRIRAGDLTLHLVPATAAWFGITSAGDLAPAARGPCTGFRAATMNEISAAFAFAEPIHAWEPVSGGHIHDSYLASGATRRYVVQRLNEYVFTDVAVLMGNYERVLAHLAVSGVRAQALVPTVEGAMWCRAGDGRAWRAFEYLEGTTGREQVDSADDAFEAARSFGEFTHAVADLAPATLGVTIPHFHDLPRRRAEFQHAIADDRAGRAVAVGAEIADARRLGARVESQLRPVLPALPERIAHNDAKIANVRFDETTRRAVCVIDLDTVTAGTILNDVGELVRTTVSHAAEDEPDPDRVALDHERLRAVAAGFATGTQHTITRAELDALALAGPWLAVENGVRFLGDYLNGDTYFRVERPHQNLDRARVQFRITAQLLDELETARAIFAAAGA